MHNIKKIIIILAIILLGSSVAYAAPYFRQEATLLPISDNAYDLGTSTKKWRRLFISGSDGCLNLTSGLIGSTGIACGTGSGGGLGWASTTVPDSNSIYSTALSNVGIGTTSPYAKLSIGGDSLSMPFLAVGSSTETVLTLTNTGRLGIGTTTTNPNNYIQVTDLINFNDTDFNTLLGFRAGSNLISGAIQNTFIGYQAGHATSSTSAVDYNTGVGYRALYNLKSGLLNSAFGTESQLNTTSGTANTSMGYQSLMSNTTGFNNVAIGRGALKNNLGGAGNTGIGLNAGLGNISGNDNFYLGQSAAQSGTSATDMVCVGRTSCQQNVSGISSVAIGRNAGNAFTGSNNVMLGYYAGAYETGSDSFYVNNTDLTDTNTDKSNSLLYGKFGGGSPTSATLNINASTTIKMQATVSASNSGTTLPATQNSPNISILNTNTTNNNYASLDFKQYNSSASTITTSKIAGVQTVHTAGSEAGNLSFLTASAGALSEKMVILANGNVGIERTAPAQKLHVKGNIRVEETDVVGRYFEMLPAVSGSLHRIISNSNAGWNIENNAGNMLLINNTGVFATTTTASASVPSFSFLGDTNTGLYTAGADITGLTTGGTARLTAIATGQVGIGTTTPSSFTKLQVNADNTFSGNEQLYLSGATNPLKTLRLGYNTTSNYGIIQAVTVGTSFDNITLNPFGGNVGIGTTTPAGLIDVGTTATSRFLIEPVASASTDPFGLGFDTAFRRTTISSQQGSIQQALQFGDASTNASTIFGVASSNDTGTSWIPGLVVKQGGNVGIGTTSPYARLSVVGEIVAKNFTATSTTATSTFAGPVKFGSTGTSKTIGNATLVAGTVTVSSGAATSGGFVHLTRKTSGGTIGTAITYTITDGSFTITSDSVLDTSTFTYLITQ